MLKLIKNWVYQEVAAPRIENLLWVALQEKLIDDKTFEILSKASKRNTDILEDRAYIRKWKPNGTA